MHLTSIYVKPNERDLCNATDSQTPIPTIENGKCHILHHPILSYFDNVAFPINYLICYIKKYKLI